MSTDRELLELAAKAAGYPLEHSISAMYPYADVFRVGSERWNPLTNDGDALRLAVKLRLVVEGGDVATLVYRHDPGVCEEHGSNAEAATRRAIVRAAAEIGKERI